MAEGGTRSSQGPSATRQSQKAADHAVAETTSEDDDPQGVESSGSEHDDNEVESSSEIGDLGVESASEIGDLVVESSSEIGDPDAVESPSEDEYQTADEDSDEDGVAVMAGNYRPTTFADVDSDTSVSSEATSSRSVSASEMRRAAEPARFQVSKLQFMLLRKRDVRESINRSSKISLQLDERSEDCIVLVRPASARNRMKSLMEREILEASFSIYEGNCEDHAFVQSLNDEALQNFTAMSLEGDHLRIAYHKSVKKDMVKILTRRRTPVRKIPLSYKPRESALFVKRYMSWILEELQKRTRLSDSEFRGKVSLRLDGWPGNAPRIQAECRDCSDNTRSRRVFTTVADLVDSITEKEIPVSLEVGLYLQSVRGLQHLEYIENKLHCTLSVTTPAEKVLLSASNGQHQVMICEGIIAAIDSEVIVLPLCEGQTEWGDLYKHVLRSECLSTDITNYHSKVGPQRAQIHIRAISSAEKRCTVIMHIPSSANPDQFVSSLKSSCTAAMLSALSEMSSGARGSRIEIVFPLRMSKIHDLKVYAMPLLMTMIDSIQARHCHPGQVVLRLFLETLSSEEAEVLSEMERKLPFLGWRIASFLAGRVTRSQTHSTEQDIQQGTVCMFGFNEDILKAVDEISSIQVPGDCRTYCKEKAGIVQLLRPLLKPASQLKKTVRNKLSKTSVVTTAEATTAEAAATTAEAASAVAVAAAAATSISTTPQIIGQNGTGVQPTTDLGTVMAQTSENVISQWSQDSYQEERKSPRGRPSKDVDSNSESEQGESRSGAAVSKQAPDKSFPRILLPNFQFLSSFQFSIPPWKASVGHHRAEDKPQFRWQYEVAKNTFEDFSLAINISIEAASKNGDPSKTIVFRYDKYTIDFKSRTVHRLDFKGPHLAIKRRDLLEEMKAEVPLPSHWEPMGSDKVKRVILKTDSPEYRTVAGIARNHFAVKKIERIQNPALFQQFEAKKKELDWYNPEGTENETQLFNSPSNDCYVDRIIAEGFDHSDSQGIMHFSSSSKQRFAQRFARSHHVFLSRVLVGESTRGTWSWLSAPVKPGTNRTYDSVSIGNGGLAIFNSSQAYPEYLVSFQ